MAWEKEDSLQEGDFAGERTADTLTDTSPEYVFAVTQDLYPTVMDTTKNYCFSAHVKKDDIEFRQVALSMHFTNNSYGDGFYVILNTKTGAYTTLGGTSTITLTALDTHWRIAISVIPVDPLNIFLKLTIHPCTVYNAIGYLEWHHTGSAEVSQVQLNKGLTPHTYIKTTTAVTNGTTQNLLLNSEELDLWSSSLARGVVTADTGAVPTDVRSWPARTPLTTTWDASCSLLGTHAVAGLAIAGCVVAGSARINWIEEVAL